jgi:hypothetical protein
MAHVQGQNAASYHEVPVRAASLDSLNIGEQQREQTFQDKAQEYGIEQHPVDIPTPVMTGIAPQRGRKSPWRTVLKMAIFYLVGMCAFLGKCRYG